jgi:L-rhamnose mutarotase
MERAGLVLKVRPAKLDEHRRRQAAVRPEMLEALHRVVSHSYSLFLCDDGLLFRHSEAAERFEAAPGAVAQEEVNARQRALMAPYVERLAAKHAGQSTVELEADCTGLVSLRPSPGAAGPRLTGKRRQIYGRASS